MKILTTLHLLKGTLQISAGWQSQRPGTKGHKQLYSRKFSAIPSFFPITVLRISMAEVYMQSIMHFALFCLFFCLAEGQKKRADVVQQERFSRQLKANFENKFKWGLGFVHLSPSYALQSNTLTAQFWNLEKENGNHSCNLLILYMSTETHRS